MSETTKWPPLPHVHAYEMTDRGRLRGANWLCTDCMRTATATSAVVGCYFACGTGWCVNHVPDAPKRRRARR